MSNFAENNLSDHWRAQLDGDGMRVALADGADPRVLEAATMLAGMGVVPVIVDAPDQVHAAARTAGINLPDTVGVLDPHELAAGSAGAAVAAAAKQPNASPQDWLDDPLNLAVGTVAAGITNACVAGATRSTAAVLRAALRIVGTAPSSPCVSSCFVMEFPHGRILAYGDCAVIPEPDIQELSEIAISTAHTFQALTDITPKVAMLSFSTLGSADHPSLETIRNAIPHIGARRPHLDVDGELQFDAAIDGTIAQSKAPGSAVAGQANVLIFPDLAAGNIAYKITERLAGATAHGPILQGLAMPINDLSRGCTAADIVGVSLISALQSKATASQ